MACLRLSLLFGVLALLSVPAQAMPKSIAKSGSKTKIYVHYGQGAAAPFVLTNARYRPPVLVPVNGEKVLVQHKRRITRKGAKRATGYTVVMGVVPSIGGVLQYMLDQGMGKAPVTVLKPLDNAARPSVIKALKAHKLPSRLVRF